MANSRFHFSMDRFRQQLDMTPEERRTEIFVHSVVELSEAQKSRLSRILAEKYDLTAPIQYDLNPNLIGGVHIRVADLLLDQTLRGKLRSLETSLRMPDLLFEGENHERV